MRLNSKTGIEGLPVSSLSSDRPLHSGIRASGSVCLSDIGCTSLAAIETYGHAGHYKQTVEGPSIDTHHTPAL